MSTKENPAQRVERIKKEKSGLDVIKDIEIYASTDKEIDPEDIDRFKWYGLYTQNKNLQGDDESLYFMLRVKLEHGLANIEQIRTMAQISKELCRDTADFTTRQDIQFHFVSVKDLPEIFKRLNEVGLSTKFAAGDVPRNVTTCAVSGIDHDEIYDTREIVDNINDFLRGNRELANLPRKYKVAVSACAKHCINHEHQDLAFSAFELNGEIVFDVTVGGGLASNKRFATSIGYAKEEQILDIVKAVSYTFRDHGLRESRKKARVGHLVSAWGEEKFKAHIEEAIGYTLPDSPDINYTPYKEREHFGVHPSKTDGYSYIGCVADGGYIGAQGLFDLADILENNGATAIRATITQNFVIEDVPNENVDTVVSQLDKIGLDSNPNPFKARLLACTGLDYCKFAVSDTKQTAVKLATHLNEKFPEFTQRVTISVNGCPNSCAHSNIANIGLQGTKVKDPELGKSVPGYMLLLGGDLEGKNSVFAENTRFKILPQNLNSILEKLISLYIESGEESINEFFKKKLEDEDFLNSIK